MKKISILFLLLLSLHLFAEPNKTQLRMLQDLKFIKNSFEVKYAPAKWKKEQFGWDLAESYEKARAEILAKPAITLKEYHLLLKRFFLSVKDYHVAIVFFSTEEATLPFIVKQADKRYFVVHQNVPWYLFSTLEVGDEIITFDGKPIHQAVRELISQEVGDNVYETDQAVGEMMLTRRVGARGESVPRGAVAIEVIKASTGQKERYEFNWNYTNEKIRDFSKIDVLTKAALPFKKKKKPHFAKNESGFFDKMMVYPYFESLTAHAALEENPHALGARRSYVPVLGKKEWEGDESYEYDAYIFTMPEGFQSAGSRIGYLRIPSYCGDKEEVDEFKALIQMMEYRTDALVIDQINNPGGSIFYLYALASMLTDRPMQAPKHHIALTQQEVHTAVGMLTNLDGVIDDASAREIIAEEIGGYDVDYVFALALKQFCELLISEWDKGHLYTKATHLFGVECVQPNRDVRYTKPLLVLTNSLDFSGGDFFPAILQDNKRALIFGTRTAGAGGYVLQNAFPNFSAIATYSVTASLAERMNREPLENLGVKPDICYELTVRDLKEGYREYADRILQALDGVMQ